MSAFAGIYFRRPQARDEQWIRRVRDAVHAHAGGHPLHEAAAPLATIWKFDPGAYDSAGLDEDPRGGVIALAGHPFMELVAAEAPRIEHVRKIAALMDGADIDALSKARGSYSFAHLSAARSVLSLGTDCLGVRPLYFREDGDKVIFSTNLQTFENLQGLDLQLDDRGAVELGAFGFCLGDRTRYRDIKCLKPGEVITFGAADSVRKIYWRWNFPSALQLSPAQSLQHVFDAFVDAVRVRTAGDAGSRVMAFLTGGLDSRCVVAALRVNGSEVNTLNFAPPRSQDLVFGAQLGAALGTDHFELPMPVATVASKIATVMPKWHASLQQRGKLPRSPALVWSGDGGSVALGHVYMTDEMADLMEAGQTQAALRLMLEHNTWRVPKGILSSAQASVVADYPLQGMLDELRDIECEDPGRALHVLLMVTDQRRHLHDHFERIYHHGCEMQLPFFDRTFLCSVLAQPVRPFIAHRFYNDWLDAFPPEVKTVPWQAYPGHVACPVAMPEGLSYQWDPDTLASAEVGRDKRRLSMSILRDVLSGRFDGDVIDSKKLALICAATLTGLKDYTYALRFAACLRTAN